MEPLFYVTAEKKSLFPFPIKVHHFVEDTDEG